MQLRRIAGIVLGLIVVSSAATSAAPKRDQTVARLATALHGLDRFFASHSLDDLQSTVADLTSAVQMTKIKRTHYVARRRAVLQAWAQVFRVIELSYDPTYDPNDRPLVCVAPPREANGVQRQPCTDPSSIQDPQARATYVAAIHGNELKLQRASLQIRLSHIDDYAMLSLRMNLDLFRATAPSDFAALDGILRQGGISEARRGKIDAML